MTIQTRTRTTFPVRPFIFLGVLVAGMAIGFAAAKWDSRESGGSGNEAVANETTGFATSYAPPPQSYFDRLAAEMAMNEALTEAHFGPLMRATVPIEIVLAELAQHDNAIEATLARTGGVSAGFESSPGTVSAGDDTSAAAEAVDLHGNAFPPIP